MLKAEKAFVAIYRVAEALPNESDSEWPQAPQNRPTGERERPGVCSIKLYQAVFYQSVKTG